MKLQTSIIPRRDGKVNVAGLKGAIFVFAPDEAGDLVCDVTDDALVTRLLVTGDFHPVNEEDFQIALALSKAPTSSPTEADEIDDGDDGDDPVDLNAMPVEGAETAAPTGSRRRNASGAK
jgi:hypothetical protein